MVRLVLLLVLEKGPRKGGAIGYNIKIANVKGALRYDNYYLRHYSWHFTRLAGCV